VQLSEATLGEIMLKLRMSIFALGFALAGVGATSALAAMGGASSVSATTVAAHAGNAAATSALANTISSGSCASTCLSHGNPEASCRKSCRPGICYFQTGSPFCIK
jgi:hypothetical protein